MGLPVVALCAKFKFLSLSSHNVVVSPLLASFLCPFLVKLACSLRLVRRASSDVIYASRLFTFQLGRIAFDVSGGTGNNQQEAVLGLGNRWGRAVRLICQRITLAIRSPATTHDDDSFHALSMFSL
ncbi:uncharacterized protein LOC8265550 [Ricinus communis]|uniref:Uncharacterized protein n=1 Tax=Ricinus communis TaxID=3988 RepID=B9SSF4_RICCO|nr:uncharacterized protein LOC8265550 [Ricinus communis]EEF33452.1 conserved hypothetical protein [Ricinus communis]|eukprot:XP_002528923.1 uncharacterized protein LOC8265550 [Ricinus communis]